MNTGSRCTFRRLMLTVALAATAGCGHDGSPAGSDGAGGVSGAAAFQPELAGMQGDVLRVRRDVARDRIWVLTAKGVRVYGPGATMRQIELPNWSVADYICPPDMALDASGSALVSSNVQARLWRIGADDFAPVERAIVLLERERWDVGFGALAFARDGALLAATSTAGGSLWSVDFGKGSARLVEAAWHGPDNCEIHTRVLAQFEWRG